LGKKPKNLRLNIDKIIDALLEVQEHFPEINRRLELHREFLTDEIIQNMVAGYKFVDNLVAADVGLFSDLGLQYMLELNHIVLCGRDPKVRLEYTHHITETRQRFYQNVQPVKRWYKKHKNESALKVASEVYVGILSRPQLYIEGNHRTGSLIATYLLLTRGSPPFVLNVDNAVAYFQPSSQIKFSDKTSFKGKLRLPKYEKAFKAFLEENLNEEFLVHPDIDNPN
jgi:hypothetical protein